MVIIVGYILYRSHIYHKKTTEESDEDAQDVHTLSEENIADKSIRTITKNLKKIIAAYSATIEGLEHENIKELKKIKRELDSTTTKTKYLKDNINVIVDKLREGSEDTAYYFVQVLDFMREMLHSMTFINNPVFEHVDNNHKPLTKEQIDELKQINIMLTQLISKIASSIESGDYSTQNEIQSLLVRLIEQIEVDNKKQIKRIKNAVVGTKNSILFMNIINESKHLALHGVNLYKSQRDFVDYKNIK